MAEISRYHRLYKFPNGATLIYFKHNINNTSEYYVGYLGGAKLDKINGTTHFLEHMLHKETPDISVNAKAEMMSDMNITTNAFTTENYIMFYTNTPNSFLKEAMEIDSKFLFNKTFDEQSIDYERMAIDEEINSHGTDDSASYPLWLSMQQIKSFDSARILGSHEDIAKINSKVLEQYIEDNFVAENMIMVVKSNKEFEEIKELFEKYFASKAKSDKTKRVYLKKPKFNIPQNIFHMYSDPKQKTVTVNFSYRSTNSDKENDLYKIVKDYIFNNGFHGRLLKKLRTENGLVYSAYYQPSEIIGGMHYDNFYITTSKEKLNRTLEVFGEIMRDICENGISQQDLDNLKFKVATAEIDRATGLKTTDTFDLLNRYVNGHELFYNNQLHFIKDLTLEDVNNHLKKVYDKKNVVCLISGDFAWNDIYDEAGIIKLINAKPCKYLYLIDQDIFVNAKTQKQVSDEELEKILNMSKVSFANNVGQSYLTEEPDESKIDYNQLDLITKLKLLQETADMLGLEIDFESLVPEDENKQEQNEEEFVDEQNEEIEK